MIMAGDEMDLELFLWRLADEGGDCQAGSTIPHFSFE
jgi:hypothetical protein